MYNNAADTPKERVRPASDRTAVALNCSPPRLDAHFEHLVDLNELKESGFSAQVGFLERDDSSGLDRYLRQMLGRHKDRLPRKKDG